MGDLQYLSEETKHYYDYMVNSPVDDWGENFPRILIFIPLERSLPYADITMPQFIRMAQHGHHFIWSEYGATAMVRNKAAFQLLGSDYTHVLMLDADHRHPADIPEMLVRWVMTYPEIKVVGGLNFGRRPPYKPACYLFGDNPDELLVPTEWDREKLLEVAMVGAGSLLISKEVFEDIPPIWFENDYSGWEHGYYAGEDTVFSRKCRENGIKMYVDPQTTSPHIDMTGITEDTFRSWYAERGLESG